MKYRKLTLALTMLASSQSAQSAIINLDFLVNVSSRQTSSGGAWITDSSFAGQQFTFSVRFDSENYIPGNVDFWSGQGVTYVNPMLYPVEFGATPFDDEINAVIPVLDYHGNTESGPYGSLNGEISYNQTFDSGTVSQSFYENSGISYYESSTRYLASFDRDLAIGFHWGNAPLTESDIVPFSLMDYLNLGIGQTYSFRQGADEEYNPNTGTTPWTLLDGGIQYYGSATISNITTVPVPAAAWLFCSGLIGLFGFARRKKA